MARVYARIGHAKGDLETGIERLKGAMKRTDLPTSTKKQFAVAIGNMKKAHALLRGIPCLQPDMSFPLYYSSSKESEASGRTTSPKKKRSSKKR